MVQAANQGLGEWTSWLDDDVISNLERSLGEVPDIARVLVGLADLEGSWDWSRYSIGELGPAYRLIEIAAQLIGEQRGYSTGVSMQIVVCGLAEFDSPGDRGAKSSPFVRCVLDVCGTFDEPEIARLRSRGLSDTQIAEVAGAAALTLFTSVLTYPSDVEDEHTRIGSMAFAG
ncbi:MAG: hypothetical protein JJ916_14925 [Phycisphaerales bacterium]|nr:hypothetical protein [Phycisphaerales bacterium]